MDVPVIEQVRIQAQVLVPLVQALQAELGEQRANAIVRKALGALYRGYGEKWWQAREGSGFGEAMASVFSTFARGDALTYRVVAQTPDRFDADVTRCRYAEFYQAMGAPELGMLLTCNADFAMTGGFGDDVTLTRTQTIMEGASHCDFRYRITRDARSAPPHPLPPPGDGDAPG